MYGRALSVIPSGVQEIKYQPLPMIQPSVKMAVKKAYLLVGALEVVFGSAKKTVDFHSKVR